MSATSKILTLYGWLATITMIVQLISGALLSLVFCASDTSMVQTFSSLVAYQLEVTTAFEVRCFHAAGPSWIVGLLYVHLYRAVTAYTTSVAFNSGYTAFLLVLGACFLGYAVVTGDLSYWGVTVILSLLGFLPYITSVILGGDSFISDTVIRLLLYHQLLPLVVMLVVLLHMVLLHIASGSYYIAKGSTLGLSFIPLGVSKDIYLSVLPLLVLVCYQCMYSSYVAAHPDNAKACNVEATPEHIVPEWYFLAAYMSLKLVPDTFAGLLALVIAVVVTLAVHLVVYSVEGIKVQSTSLLTLSVIPLVHVALMVFGALIASELHMVTSLMLFIAQLLYPTLPEQTCTAVCNSEVNR